MSRGRAAAGWIGPVVALALLVCGAVTDVKRSDDISRASATSAHVHVGFRFPDDGWMGTYSVNGRPTFCIDLNGRGPSTAGGYDVAQPSSIAKQVGWSRDHTGGTADALTGAALTPAQLAQLAYLTDRYAATTSPVTAAAAEHVVRLLTIGDAAQATREKVRWAQTIAAHPKVKPAYTLMAKDVHDHAGPYTIKATWATRPTAVASGSLRVTVLSAVGLAMAKVAVAGTATGAPGPQRFTGTTDRTGTASFAIAAQVAGALDVSVTARALAAAVPLLYTPAHYADPRSPDHAAQRTVGAAPRISLTAAATATITSITPKLTTTAQPKAPSLADDLTDDLTVSGALPAWEGTVAAMLWGPFPVRPKPADCSAQPAPAAQTSVDVTTDDRGAGTATTPAVTAAVPGWYTWTETMSGTPLQTDVSTACAAASETFVVSATPALSLAVSGTPAPGSPLDADLTLSGSFPGGTSKVTLTLYGPFAAPPSATDCAPKVRAATAGATFTGDETVTAATASPGQTGYYTWTAVLPASPMQNAATIDCGDPGSTFAVARPDLGALDVTNTSTAGAVTPATRPPTAGPLLAIATADRTATIKAPLTAMSRQGPGVATPDSIALAGELDVGAHAGDRWGTVVVAGRVSDAQGIKGALFTLSQVAPGDTITLTDTNRRTQRFTVDSVTTQPRLLPLPADLFTQGQNAPLRLVVLSATDAVTYGAGLLTHFSHMIVTATAV